jgi:hypothetical protein
MIREVGWTIQRINLIDYAVRQVLILVIFFGEYFDFVFFVLIFLQYFSNYSVYVVGGEVGLDVELCTRYLFWSD